MELSVPIQSDPRFGRTIRFDTGRSVRRSSSALCAGRVLLPLASSTLPSTSTSTPTRRTHVRRATRSSVASSFVALDTVRRGVHVTLLPRLVSSQPEEASVSNRVLPGSSTLLPFQIVRFDPGVEGCVSNETRTVQDVVAHVDVAWNATVRRSNQPMEGGRGAFEHVEGAEGTCCGDLDRRCVPSEANRSTKTDLHLFRSTRGGTNPHASSRFHDAARKSDTETMEEKDTPSTTKRPSFIAKLRLVDATPRPTSKASLPALRAMWHAGEIPTARNFQDEVSPLSH